MQRLVIENPIFTHIDCLLATVKFISCIFLYIVCKRLMFLAVHGWTSRHFLLLIFLVPEYLPVSLGASLGKVAAGSHTTAGFKEDKRNKATPGKS